MFSTLLVRTTKAPPNVPALHLYLGYACYNYSPHHSLSAFSFLI